VGVDEIEELALELGLFCMARCQRGLVLGFLGVGGIDKIDKIGRSEDQKTRRKEVRGSEGSEIQTRGIEDHKFRDQTRRSDDRESKGRGKDRRMGGEWEENERFRRLKFEQLTVAQTSRPRTSRVGQDILQGP
jgi:hypothetical protein